MANHDRCNVTVRIFHPHTNLDEKRISSRINKIMRFADIKADELSVIFVDDSQMTGYNKSYLGRDDTTDVLAFPCNETNEEGKFYLGDIIISVETAERQAKELGHDFNYETDILLTHALLHLAGYDHTRDKGRMIKEQERIIQQLYGN